jgi:integrase
MIKYRINWILDKPTDDGISLRMRVKWNNSKSIVSFSLPYRVDAEKWSSEAQRCFAKSFHTSKKISAAIINRNINAYEKIVSDIFATAEELTTAEVKEQFLVTIGKKQPKSDTESFSIIYNEFLDTESKRNNWANNTFKKFTTLRTNLLSYKQNITLQEIDLPFIQGFYHYITSVKKFRNSTNKSLLKSLTWFLRWATKNGYYEGNAHTLFSAKLKGADNTQAIYYLTWNELMQMCDTEMPTTYLEQVRDVYVFCCFTSLRYSDVYELKKNDIHDNYILITTQKTNTEVKIELNDYSRDILNKYKEAVLPNNKALPVISNQKYNQYLKEVARISGITSSYKRYYYIGSTRYEESGEKWQFITSHSARRTFVVNALYLGIPAEVIMRWTGHSDYDAMKPYIDIVDELKQEQMKKFNKH